MAYAGTRRQSDYSTKLRDPRWQKLRLQVLERDEWTCQLCCDSESTLHVHHKTYQRGKEPWEYELDNFLTLCESCHEEESKSRQEMEQLLLGELRRAGLLANDLLALATAFHDFKPQHVMDVSIAALAWLIASPELQRSLINQRFAYLAECKKVRAEQRTTEAASG